MEPMEPVVLTECEGILFKIDPAPYDLRKAILALEKRVSALEKIDAARNTPALPQPEHSPKDESPVEHHDGE